MDDKSQGSEQFGGGTTGQSVCPVCGGHDVSTILTFSTPRLCNVLFAEKADAVASDFGRVTLAFCRECTHTFNSTFASGNVSYSPQYDSSLEHSPRFICFSEELARRLDKSYSLSGKTIVEIGCGKGDFLKRLCALSGAQGVGFDTSFDDGRGPAVPGVTFVRDYFRDAYSDLSPDLLICRHVLEHIEEPVAFLRSLSNHPAVNSGTCIYCEVPNSIYTLRYFGIWDLIYEHASYFTMTSLCRAFQTAGFEILDAGTSFGEQYLFVEARVNGSSVSAPSTDGAGVSSLAASFADVYRARIARWSHYIARNPSEIVVWGAGSKGITFINAVPGGRDLGALVDVNPNKQGRFAPNHGTPVISPRELNDRQTRSIIVVNPIYADEIARMAAAVAPTAELVLA